MIDYIKLGGTLFIPATHKDLEAVVSGLKYPSLKSLVIDTEDSISDAELNKALDNLENMLHNFTSSSVLIFIRPRNVSILKKLLLFENIDKVDGFVLAKFTLNNADNYLETLENTPYYIMPSIEGKELFQSDKLSKLCDKLLVFEDKIILVRFGLEDMLRQLKMRRECEDSIFDFSVTSTVLGNFIAIFKSAGFEVSGGVYPCFKDIEGFKKDVKRDLKEGLFSKTIIHPSHIDVVNDLYKVKQKDYFQAQEILQSSKNVFTQGGKMAEKTTMYPYSEYIISRALMYGVDS